MVNPFHFLTLFPSDPSSFGPNLNQPFLSFDASLRFLLGTLIIPSLLDDFPSVAVSLCKLKYRHIILLSLLKIFLLKKSCMSYVSMASGKF